ncbi:AMP-binding protein [Gilliamella sp. ESL0250]|uniref:AMP-binding protein n=1 Tax=Gilliamella sp. ESL0250 TaxID=2705036 RepID=UPI0015809B57|nr:AMP-binding protein [Gilliamella sp. ESL0250]NUF48711.1 acyl-CoA synthetase [Gilliamella sp. ESL0250]
MVNTSESTTLMLLSKQLLRQEHEIVAFRNNQPLTIGELKKQVLKITNVLNNHPNKRWALRMQDSFNFIAGLLALLYSGKQPILINPHPKEMEEHYDALLIDDIKFTNQQFLCKQIIDINQIDKNRTITEEQLIASGFKNSKLILFTSGSTGLPKPIEKSISQLELEIDILISEWREFKNDLFIASVSHEHMYGLTFKIMLPLCCKIPFICEPVLYQEQLTTQSHKKIIYITTPSILKNLDDKLPTINCDKVISSGGKLAYKEALLCQKSYGVLPNEIYGSSETGIIATRQQTQADIFWQLFPSMRIECKQSKPPLLISPLLTQPEPLHDEIKKIDNNHFYLNGRIDKIIKISENRVSLTFIEKQFNQLDEVAQAIVIPLEQNNRTILGAVIELSLPYKQLLHEYKHFELTQYFRLLLKDTLSLIEIPKKWRFVEFLPQNAQGKCSYIDLKILFDAPEKQ